MTDPSNVANRCLGGVPVRPGLSTGAGAQAHGSVSVAPESDLFVWTRHVQRLRAAGRRRGAADRSRRRQRARPPGRDRRAAGRVGAVHASSSRAVPGGRASWQAWKPQIAAPEAERALFEEPDAVPQGEALAGRRLHGTRGQLRPAARRADPAGSHLQGPGRVHLARPRVAVPGDDGQQSGRHVLPAEAGRPLARLQRRRDARRRQDAHVVRHRMGLRLRQGAVRADQLRQPAPELRAGVSAAFARPGRRASRQAQLQEYQREAPPAGQAVRARLRDQHVRRRRPGHGVEADVDPAPLAGHAAPVQVQDARTSGPTSGF